jgi:tetratricopeptide (TPR) repeat protein
MKKISLGQKIMLIGLGIILFFLLLELGLRVSGQILLLQQHIDNKLTVNTIENLNNTYVILTLGESTTADLHNNQSSWPRELEPILNSKNANYTYVVLQEAIPSTNTKEILYRLNKNLDQYNPNMVITMMGINDAYSIVPYNSSVNKITHVFNSFRTYKLLTSLILNIEQKFKKSLTKDEYFKLGQKYIEKEEYHRAEEMYKNILEQSPKNTEGYIGLGRVFYRTGEYNKAKKILFETIKQFPKDDRIDQAYIILGKVYREQMTTVEVYHEQNDVDIAEKMFKAAIALNPENYHPYSTLGIFYGDIGKDYKSEKMLKKAIELNPTDGYAYFELGVLYCKIEEYDKAKAVFKKAVDLKDFYEDAYIWLAWVYQIKNEPNLAEEVLKNGIEQNPDNDILYGSLAQHYEDLGQYDLAEKYFEKANNIRLKFYNPITNKNYKELNAILKKRGVTHVIMQYPMRSVEPLKKMFKDRSDIIFVDNENVFKKAVKEKGTKQIFVDMFGGEFGHCTLKGNKLIAENVANVILKENSFT